MVPRPVQRQSRRYRGAEGTADIPDPRGGGMGPHPGVAVHSPRARVELSGVVLVAAVRRLPQPPRHPAQRAWHRWAQVAQDRRSVLTWWAWPIVRTIGENETWAA